ncbi:uncharacterized protein LOC127283609 [Leptopilina boulardi]|uniref:uncharacterized protein LOC127283609 n=1 Tax=Leptopilina boulardi TaxID=63433 RepID=UPI0021F66747|nr:uncharacterized protein LOC127283609 [Leptopilina boulardi]
MKYVLFFAGVVLFQMMSTVHGNKEMFLACAKELGISEAALKEGPGKNMKKPEFRCIHACVMKKDGSLEAGNKLNLDKMRENAPKHLGDKADAMINAATECAETSKNITDECDFVNELFHCIFEKIPDLKKHPK